jgi:tetratricopeptide (TPR) repeat protein
MGDNPRLEELRRRVQQDPSSIAFAQLAEEYRRGGQLEEAVDVCRAGLAIHPGYLSARVTLGRALLELQQFERAQEELELVLKSAAENLAAIRGLAEIHHRRGSLAEALVQYRAALALARNDPDLEQTVSDLTARLEPVETEIDEGLSLDQAASELFLPATVRAAPADPPAPDPSANSTSRWTSASTSTSTSTSASSVDVAARPTRTRAVRTVAALEKWLQAIHASRLERHA